MRKNIHSFLAFFVTFACVYSTSGQSPSDLKKHDDFHLYHSYSHDIHDVYVSAGGEVPWPPIIKPYWGFSDGVSPEAVVKREGIIEHKINSQSVGLWQEIGPVDNPKVFEVKIVKNEDSPGEPLFEILRIDFKTHHSISSGQGYLENWPGLLWGRYNSEHLVKQIDLDRESEMDGHGKGYFIVLHSSKSDESSEFLRLVQVQSSASEDELFLGVSIRRTNGHQSNHLLRRVEE